MKAKAKAEAKAKAKAKAKAEAEAAAALLAEAKGGANMLERGLSLDEARALVEAARRSGEAVALCGGAVWGKKGQLQLDSKAKGAGGAVLVAHDLERGGAIAEVTYLE